MEDRNPIELHIIIELCTPELVTAICDCVNDVSNRCLKRGLITGDLWDDIVCLGRLSGKDKARNLLRAVRHIIEIKSDCFEKFICEVLSKILRNAILKG